jgi:tripartite-type tricarboxylate transporter receptor subunit TctC
MSCLTSAFRLALAAILLAAVGAWTPAIASDAYPTRPVTIVVPYPPGGPTDTYARLIAEAMGRVLGQQFVVENIGGAGGTIGTGKAATAKPDGYTLLVHQVGLPIGAALYRNLNHDAANDLAGVGLINYGPALVIGRKSLPADNLTDLVKWMGQPGQRVRFAHAGVGSLAHFCGILFADAFKVEVDHIPYRGGGPALNDVIAGHVDLNCASLVAGDHVRSGAIKGFGVSSKERSKALPDVPSFVEAGYPGMEINSWHALFTRAGTPTAIVAKLTDALQKALKDEKVVTTFDRTGVVIYPAAQQTPEAAMTILKDEIKRWGDIIRAHNITPPN